MVVLQAEELELVDVLFIANDPDLAEMYRLKLELDGYWVRTVGLGTAVAAARSRRLEIVNDVRRAVRRPDLPSVVLSGSTRAELVRNGAVLGAVDHVVRIASAR